MKKKARKSYRIYCSKFSFQHLFISKLFKQILYPKTSAICICEMESKLVTLKALNK